MAGVGKWRVRLTAYFRDQFLKATPPIKALEGCHYSEYQVQGSNVYFGNWTYTREINTPYTQPDGSTQFYSTADFYPRKPYWWETGTMRLNIIGNELIKNVGQSESCMISKLRIIFKRTRRCWRLAWPIMDGDLRPPIRVGQR